MSKPNVMLGSLSIGHWTARKIDKASAGKIEADAGAKSGVASASKKLMHGVAEHEAIIKKATLIRNEWSKISLPWFDGRGGPRAVAAAGVMDISQQVGDWKREYFELVDAFIPVYGAQRAERAFDMGTLFDPRDFPRLDEIKRKFYFEFSWCALPNADDIRLAEGLSKEEAEALAEEAREAEVSRLKTAMDTAASRLYEVVSSMHKTMAVPDAKFHNTKLENINKLVDLMPGLNIANDPKLIELTKKAKLLALKSPDELRNDVDARARAAKEAKTLAEQLAGAFDVDVEEE